MSFYTKQLTLRYRNVWDLLAAGDIFALVQGWAALTLRTWAHSPKLRATRSPARSLCSAMYNKRPSKGDHRWGVASSRLKSHGGRCVVVDTEF